MLLQKILCVVLLSEHVIYYSPKIYVNAQTYHRNIDKDVYSSKDLMFTNYSDNGCVSESQLNDLLLTMSLRTLNFPWHESIQQLIADAERSQARNEFVDYALEPHFNQTYHKFNVQKRTGLSDQYNNSSADLLTTDISYDRLTGKNFNGENFNEINWKDGLKYDGTTPVYVAIDDKVNYKPTIKKLEPKKPIRNITTFIDIVKLIIERIQALDAKKQAVLTNITRDHLKTSNKTDNDYVMQLSSKYKTKKTEKTVRRLVKRSAPECPSKWGLPSISWGTTKPDNMHKYDANRTGDLVSTCYVCGLEDEKIPFTAICEKAFSEDGPETRHKYHFKKYCRYLDDENNYCVKSKEPRSVFGHWTGGCSFRRIDISGVYTQRTCRNQVTPTMGLSFASHRMAKLELTLNGVKDGCVISPSASLVPLSRSVSLYARFQACVCTGWLCNTGVSHYLPSQITYVVLCMTPFIVNVYLNVAKCMKMSL